MLAASNIQWLRYSFVNALNANSVKIMPDADDSGHFRLNIINYHGSLSISLSVTPYYLVSGMRFLPSRRDFVDISSIIFHLGLYRIFSSISWALLWYEPPMILGRPSSYARASRQTYTEVISSNALS